jgi:hypothetical protein
MKPNLIVAAVSSTFIAVATTYIPHIVRGEVGKTELLLFIPLFMGACFFVTLVGFPIFLILRKSGPLTLARSLAGGALGGVVVALLLYMHRFAFPPIADAIHSVVFGLVIGAVFWAIATKCGRVRV